MAQHVALTVKQVWRDVSIDNMILVGGFGQVLFPLLSQYPYFASLVLASDSRYFNVKGAFEYVTRIPDRSAVEAVEA